MFDIPVDEIKRKLFHLLTLIYVFGYWFLSKDMVLWVMGSIIVVVFIVEMMRLNMPSLNVWALRFLGGVHRPWEASNISGLPWTLLGSFLTMLLFENKNLVLISLFYLALGDASAALFGKFCGKHKIFWYNKTFEGSIACFVICFAIGIPFLGLPLALLGAFIATIIEIVSWPLNDNFWMPLVSCAFLTILKNYLF